MSILSKMNQEEIYEWASVQAQKEHPRSYRVWANGFAVGFSMGKDEAVGKEDLSGEINMLTALFNEAIQSRDELFDALEGLMWRFEQDDSDPHETHEVAPDVAAARAAIAKAEGK